MFDNLKLMKALTTVAKNLHLTGRLSDAIILELFQTKFGLVSTGLTNTNFSDSESYLLALVKNPLANFATNYISDQVFGKANVFNVQLLSVLKDYGGVGQERSRSERYYPPHDTQSVRGFVLLGTGSPTGPSRRRSKLGSGVHYNLFFAFSSTRQLPGTDIFFRKFNVDLVTRLQAAGATGAVRKLGSLPILNGYGIGRSFFVRFSPPART